ncbi:hypothetical protein L3Q82_002530 [Scortum barcoo]|uniref:Uncharacterized protein n=1 Tax=Scortum barcoo TaxID=214431 RepID=A0ACB8VYL6_9TELE|nr:hypothetical protein L3Q82_002530 [Scortum barcoo]
MSFLRRVAGRSLRDRVRSSVIREELGVEPLLLRIERSQLRWLGHLFRMPPGRLPREVFQACPTGRRPREDPGHAGETMSLGLAWERLGIPPEELEEVSGVGEGSVEVISILPVRPPPSGTCPEHLPREASRRASETDAQATSADFSRCEGAAVLYSELLSLREHPATLWRKLISAACIRDLDLVLSVITQSS